MIISFFNRNEPGVRGTINTGGDAPSATGVGERILETWLETHKDQSVESAMNSLEAFYSSWQEEGDFSAVEPSGVDPDELSVVLADPMQLVRGTPEGFEIREDGEWVQADSSRSIEGKRVPVSTEILEAWDGGEITDEDSLADYKKEN